MVEWKERKFKNLIDMIEILIMIHVAVCTEVNDLISLFLTFFSCKMIQQSLIYRAVVHLNQF